MQVTKVRCTLNLFTDAKLRFKTTAKTVYDQPCSTSENGSDFFRKAVKHSTLEPLCINKRDELQSVTIYIT